MKRKIKYLLFILNLNLIMISCQTKSTNVNLDILKEPYQSLVTDKKVYQLRYRDYTDSLHTRIVLKDTQIKENWQVFKNDLQFDYMDVYFNKEKVIGFKGFIPNSSKNNWDNIYKNIVKKISDDKNYTLIDIKNNDTNILYNEWESTNVILGLKYEKVNTSIALIVINKNELSNFSDKIFYSEFLDLTKLRTNKSEIHLKKLDVAPSKNDKNFYKEKFKDLKDEYNRK